MSLSTGHKLGHYEILEPIGKGGMDSPRLCQEEVYRARDTKLDRDVAIKVLPEELAADPERLARFEREAKLLASLNHPNIASIHGFEESDGINALVLELVEGPTLAERIEQGPIPVDEALPIAKEIAEALEAGHEAGIIHRDLKPANIKLKEDGTVKVLDYGLAKALEGETPSGTDAALSQSPTLTRQGTAVGVILGTAAYMSPEQATGKRVDKRTDVWAFGAVVYEMLTGRRLFNGDTTSEVLAAVIKSEIELSGLPPDTPGSIRRMLERCLRREPKLRTPHIGGARLDVEEALMQPQETLNRPAEESRLRWALVFAVSVVVLLVGVALASLLMESRPAAVGEPNGVTRFIVPIASPERGWTPAKDIALSPNGRTLVFVGESNGVTRLYRRDMDMLAAAPIAGTEGASQPFFSPNGEWLAFEAEDEIRRVPLEGGAPARAGDAPSFMSGGAWTGNDDLVIGSFGEGLFRVSANGGELEPLTRLRGERGEIGHLDPFILPGGRVVLFTTGYGSHFDPTVDAFSLETGEYHHVAPGMGARYVQSGHLIVGHADGTLTATPFDVVRVEVTGEPVTVVEDVRGASSQARRYAVSADGTLAYVSAGEETPPGFPAMWVDRVGRMTPVDQHEAELGFIGPRFSPDDTRVVGGTVAPGRDLWILGVSDGSAMRLTFHSAPDIMPIWSPDGTFIVFESLRDGGGLYWKSADGSGTVQRVTDGPKRQIPYGWVDAPDATTGSDSGWKLVFGEFDAETGWDIRMMDWGDPGSASYLLRTESDEFNAALSPDGRWLAYTSDESGREEVYVQPYPQMNGKWQVSRDGGLSPVWVKGGRELIFQSGPSWLAVDVDGGSSFAAGVPRTLFRDANSIPFGGLILGRMTSGRNFDVSADGERFLVNRDPRSDAESGGVEVVVVRNWTAELTARVATGN